MILKVWSFVASLGLISVLVSSTVFSFDSARTMRAATNEAKIADALRDDFQAAQYAVAGEESLERKYRLEPRRDVFLEHRAVAASLVSTMQAIAASGDAHDRIVVADVLRAHTSYLNATSRMFAAVDHHDSSLIIQIDHGAVDPVFGHIERAVRQRATTHAKLAASALQRLTATEHRLFAITTLLSTLGLLSLGIFLAVLLSYQRRLKARHQAELVELERVALVDNLTGIGNHRAFQEDLEREAARVRRHGETLSLAMIDIDHFKVINDRNGHLHGDHILRMFAALLGSLRAQDRPYRVGGDEFAVFLPNTSRREAHETMQRFRADAANQLFGTTVTIGLATLTGAECVVEVLQAQADAAMYSGKRAGRNSVTSFDVSIGNMWLSPKKYPRLASAHRSRFDANRFSTDLGR